MFRERTATVDGFFFLADINWTFRIYQPLSGRCKMSTTGLVLTGPYYTGRASKKKGLCNTAQGPFNIDEIVNDVAAQERIGPIGSVARLHRDGSRTTFKCIKSFNNCRNATSA